MVTIAGKINYCSENLEITHRFYHLFEMWFGFFPSAFPPHSLQKILFSYIRIWPKESYWLVFTDTDLSWYCTVFPPIHSYLSEIKIKSFTDYYFCLSHWVWLYQTLSEKPNKLLLSTTLCKLDRHPQKRNCRTHLGNCQKHVTWSGNTFGMNNIKKRNQVRAGTLSETSVLERADLEIQFI